jgi:hypothetical protein
MTEPIAPDASAVVSAQQLSAETMVSTHSAALVDFISALQDLHTNLVYIDHSSAFTYAWENAPVYPGMPTKPTLTFVAPTKPTKDTALTKPTLAATKPTLSATKPTKTAVAPTKPSAADLVPDKIAIPAMPVLTLPVFTGTFDFTDAAYDTTDILTFRARLVDFITNGGTGLAAAVEAAIYARDTARRAVEQEKLLLDVQSFHEGRGFSMPSGQYTAAVNNVLAENARQNQLLSNDIMIKAAELEQENMRIAQDNLIKVDLILTELHDKRQQRLLAAETAEFEAEVKIHEIDADAVLKQLEMYNLTVNAIVAQNDASIRFVLGLISLYTAEVDAFGKEIQAYATEVSAYGEEIRAYATEVGAYDSEIGAFVKEMEAFLAEKEIYIKEISAFLEETRAEATRIEALANVYDTEMRGTAAVYQQLTDKVRADVEKYKAQSDHNVRTIANSIENDKINVELQNNRIKIDSDALLAAVQSTTQIIASALNTLNTSASIGHSVSSNYSHSFDETKAVVPGLQTFEYHNYNE